MNKGDYIVCPKCKGKGVVFDHVFGVFTFGLGYLFQVLDDSDKDDCPRCNGSGFIKVK